MHERQLGGFEPTTSFQAAPPTGLPQPGIVAKGQQWHTFLQKRRRGGGECRYCHLNSSQYFAIFFLLGKRLQRGKRKCKFFCLNTFLRKTCFYLFPEKNSFQLISIFLGKLGKAGEQQTNNSGQCRAWMDPDFRAPGSKLHWALKLGIGIRLSGLRINCSCFITNSCLCNFSVLGLFEFF